ENPEGDRCPFDLSKPLPLKGRPSHLTVALEYFFKNNLEYLKSTDSKRKYTTSITKTKAARFSKHDVYSLLKILSVVSVKVNKLHDYGYLEEIVVRRVDHQLYKFKEGDFVNLHLNDVKDMLLLLVVSKPHGKRAIGTKWVYRNKKDERGIVIRNKARGMFMLSTPGFEDPEFPDKVYKVEIALYGLHQAPRAWYETLSTYLLDNRFQRGHIDKTLFIKRVKGDILLMSSMGELNFFLGLQVTQKDDGIFISQDNFKADIVFAVCALCKISRLTFDLGSFTDSDFAGASLDKKSTKEVVNLLELHLVAVDSVWIQNQMLDLGYIFMNTRFSIDNEAPFCIAKNPSVSLKDFSTLRFRNHFIKVFTFIGFCKQGKLGEAKVFSSS
ncbi:putative ribonuclease H-like domain-containing protein, partial [Tanacetum coccineum]